MMPSPLELSLTSVLIFLFTAVISPVLARRQESLINISFSLSAVATLMVVFAGFRAVTEGSVDTLTLPVGLPDLPFYLRLDPLSGFFLCVIGLLGFFVSIYSIGYVRGYLGHRPVTTLVLFYSLFMAGMLMVVLSDDAYFFMVSWELMAASSYFLVTFEDEVSENRKAAFIYLLVAHVGAVFILLSFGLLAGFASGFERFDGYTFSAMRASTMPALWASVAFLFAFTGFAAKAGVVPLHVWLPEAHPAAPSNISSLMSGVMIKTAIYGIVRLTFDLIGNIPWWWGVVVLIFGLISAVMGVLYALMQHDLKRLLAYHSVENIGIILIGIGLAMVFVSFQIPLLAALALIAGLYHTLNHSIFKGLLFMGAGAVVHSTRERNMEEMGGLIHRMPWTAAFFLVGCLSISALPPFNGFVSEWLTFQTFLLSPALPSDLMKVLIPLGAALLALAGTLAATCFVKVFGVVFLGHPRGHHHGAVHEVNLPMRVAMLLAAVTCLLLGVLPTFVIGWLDIIPQNLFGAGLHTTAGEFGWLWLTPVAAERASYSAPIVFAWIISVFAIVYIVFHVKKVKVRRAPLWDCGFEKVTSRMQYNATSFSMPIRRIFGYLFSINETVRVTGKPVHPRFFPERISYALRIRDRFWYNLYNPLAEISFWISRRVGRLQQGRIQMYLLYSFITIIVLLVLAS